MSTSSGFPLLKLPLLPLETCVNLMNPNTLLQLARHSKQFKSRLSIVKYKIESVEWRLSNYRTGVIIKSNSAEWDFRIESPVEFDQILRQRGIQVESINLNGTTVSLAKRVGSGRIDFWLMDSNNSSESRIDTLKNLTKMLTSFVSCSKFRLEYYSEENLLSKDFFVWQYLDGYPIDLEIHGELYGYESRTTADNLKFLLDNVKFGELCLNICVNDPDFKYQGFVEARELVIWKDNTWLDLKNINSKKVILHTAPKKFEKIEQTLKNWIQGSSMEKLEYLQISYQRYFNPDEHLRNLKHENTRFSHADISKRIGYVSDDCVFRDIRRESDGHWGTLCKSKYSIYFIVWTPEKLEECCQETRNKLGLE